jgi:hypothetical protein
MESCSRSGPWVATICASGSTVPIWGREAASAVAGCDDGLPKAVRSSVMTRTVETAVSPAKR